jgi:hypothetical protein
VVDASGCGTAGWGSATARGGAESRPVGAVLGEALPSKRDRGSGEAPAAAEAGDRAEVGAGAGEVAGGGCDDRSGAVPGVVAGMVAGPATGVVAGVVAGVVGGSVAGTVVGTVESGQSSCPCPRCSSFLQRSANPAVAPKQTSRTPNKIASPAMLVARLRIVALDPVVQRRPSTVT